MGNYKEITKQTYQRNLPYFISRFNKYGEELHYLNEITDNFLKNIPKHGLILDVGSGSGNYASIFKNKGYNVVCIDNVPGMILECKQKGLESRVMDFEHLIFPKEHFHGVWAYASLSHIPKNNFPSVLSQISSIMKKSGSFYLSMKCGKGEGFVENKDINSFKYVARYDNFELRQILQKHFRVTFYKETNTDTKYLNYILRKKS